MRQCGRNLDLGARHGTVHVRYRPRVCSKVRNLDGVQEEMFSGSTSVSAQLDTALFPLKGVALPINILKLQVEQGPSDLRSWICPLSLSRCLNL